MTTLEIQRRLKALGHDPGPEDGAMGPLTRKAIAAFQAEGGLVVDGVAGPDLLRRLFPEELGAAELAPWYAEALRRKGLHEGRDRAELARFLRSDGRTLGDPAQLPWCGDFVETCLALSVPDEPLPSNPYLARNWLRLGEACEPTLGAVLVFWRGSKAGASGHVGFYAGEDAAAFHVLGGNQATP
jgi:uncharacterized protein (TIGR02594 family)